MVKKMVVPVLLVAMSAVVMLGCAASIGTSPKGLEVPIEKAAVKFAADTKSGAYKVVAIEELKKWMDEKRAMTIISALPKEEDAQLGTIPGAVNSTIPKTEKELTQADRDSIIKAAGSDKSRTIVVYCGFVACRRSHMGASILSEAGFTNVYRAPAGLAGWLEMKYPVAK